MIPVADPATALAWLTAEDDGWTGFDPTGWPATIWILHAMWESDRPTTRTHHEAHPGPHTMVRGVDLDERSTNTGIPLGFVTDPGPGWHRLSWRDLTGRLELSPESMMDAPPCHRWFPYRSWPASIQPPPEGSLDEVSLTALIRLLDGPPCYVYFAQFAQGLYRGRVRHIPTLLDQMSFSPNNIWPFDRNWFVLTDYDLMATKVSGSRELIEAIAADPDLETVHWPFSV